jgi:hypothetical protein
VTPLEVLTSGRAKIVGGWNRGWFSVKSDGTRCDPSDPEAVRFCSIGALRSATKEPGRVDFKKVEGYLEAFMLLKKSLPEPYESVAKFNDDQGSAYPILELYDRAIEIAKHGAP